MKLLFFCWSLLYSCREHFLIHSLSALGLRRTVFGFSSGLAIIPLLPAVHVKCKALEDLTEFLAPLDTAASRRILELATAIWTTATAIEVLGFSQEILPEAEFSDLAGWVRCHYPLIYLAFQSQAVSQVVCVDSSVDRSEEAVTLEQESATCKHVPRQL